MRRVDGRGVFNVEGGGGGLQEEPKPQWPPRSRLNTPHRGGGHRRGGGVKVAYFDSVLFPE